MGCVHSSCSESNEAEIGGKARKTQVGCATDEKKMLWGLSLMILLGLSRRQRKKEGENNQAWLLADSALAVADSADPQSVHSSFRFSFGSQVELESLAFNSSSSAAATVLMVNLEKNSQESSSSVDSNRIRQIGILERSISSVQTSLIRFSYAEICFAAENFCRGKVLGRGANSCVFRGKLGFRRVVAIKRLDNEDKESAKAFYRELMIASSLDNPNVVPLVGFCVDPEGLFLVYKYVSGGSLEHHLHGKKRGKKPPLSWSVRYKVALRVAEAIAYLHNGNEKCVVHRDIKPSNILLTSKKSPKLCDFGLATWTPAPSVPFLCKTVKGTFGYLAPEYFQHGKVSDKTDVYAFGVVLLELLTGRKPIETRGAAGEENLVAWAKPLMQQEAMETLMDPHLTRATHNVSQVNRVIQAASSCLASEESRRPSIVQVLSGLRGEKNSMEGRSGMIRHGSVYSHFRSCDLQKRNEMQSHLALAMLGVTDFDDDDFYCR
ncbi:probable serine/threonine-protein kinase PBL23 isoform X1 [Aristolochia californica]|uniref:probable serine/threonine-protein kinase PBL23 isoform X1 n=2 Tax=Aristolochia californica TaxID=171875 RepID=UPI0035E1FE16